MNLLQLDQPTPQPVGRREFDTLAKRVNELEKSVKFLSTSRPMVDGARTPYGWGDSAGEPYYHRTYGDLSGTLGQIAPWMMSATTQFSERLTSVEFLKVTVGSAFGLAAGLTGLAALIAWQGSLPSSVVVGTGIISFTAGFIILIFDNRWNLRTLTKGQADKNKRKHQKLEIEVTSVTPTGQIDNIKRLEVAGIQEDQLRKFAPQVLKTGKLTINDIGGGGKLFSQPQAQTLCTELEFMEYATHPRGNIPRKLTREGASFFLSLLTRDDFKSMGWLNRETLGRFS